MATTSHTIYSHYDPKDRERLEQETGQVDEKLKAEESWKTEPSKYRNNAPPPRFVPASLAYDTWGFALPSSSRRTMQESRQGTDSEIADWYRSLRKNLSNDATNIHRPTSAPAAATQQTFEASKAPVALEIDKNNWFIMNAITSESLSSGATLKPSQRTIADILAHDPPPKPTDPKYTPPVFLQIGPNNRGFAMLQKSGWNEGEALGPDIVRQKQKVEDGAHCLFGNAGNNTRKTKAPTDVYQLGPEDVIDLTLSDSESGIGDSDKQTAMVGGSEIPIKSEVNTEDPTSSEEGDENLAHRRKALVTPLATVLKSDRLGIGLKAKTVGPYKASLKRITHNAAALAAHIRAAEELRKKKRETGRGRRGCEKQYKNEMMKRQMMLAYLNS